jgi:hypothetical protein
MSLWISLGSEGAEAGGGTDAAVSGGGARAAEGAPSSRATGAIAAVSFGSEEAGTVAEAVGGTDAAVSGGGARAGEGAADAGARGTTAATRGSAESGIVEMTRGSAFGASPMSMGCSLSLGPAVVTDIWVSLLFRTMLLVPVLALMIGRSAGNPNPPNMAR